MGKGSSWPRILNEKRSILIHFSLIREYKIKVHVNCLEIALSFNFEVWIF